jgi:hypothetical protein
MKKWREFPSNIQDLLKDAYYGFNISSTTRIFIKENQQIYSKMGLDPRMFRGITYE